VSLRPSPKQALAKTPGVVGDQATSSAQPWSTWISPTWTPAGTSHSSVRPSRPADSSSEGSCVFHDKLRTPYTQYNNLFSRRTDRDEMTDNT
jgi:hypothetical protein